MEFLRESGGGNAGYRWIFALAVVWAILLNSIFIFVDGIPSLLIDFEVFWKSARSPDVYEPSLMPFAYPPTALLFFKPLALVPLQIGFVIWTTLSLFIFIFAATRLTDARIAGWSLLSGAAIHGLILGQSAMLLSGLILLAFLAPPFASGIVLGIVASIKPQLLLFAPIAFFVRRDWWCVGGMLVGAMAMVITEGLVFGPGLWAEWRNAFSAFHDAVVEGGSLHMVISPAGQAEYLGLSPMPLLVAGGLIGAVAVIRMARWANSEMLAALIVAASLMASPYAHIHDTIAIIPMCLVILRGARPAIAVLAAVVFAGVPALVPWVLLIGLAFGALWPAMAKHDVISRGLASECESVRISGPDQVGE